MNNLCKLSFLLVLLILTSCSDDGSDIIIINPANYTFERNGASTVSYTGQTDRILMATELINAMKDENTTASQLLEMYANETATGEDADPYADASLNESTKSVKSKTAASRDFFSSNTAESASIKADFETWINAQVNEVFPNWNELAAEGQAGQIADGSSTRYVNGGGLEYNQAVNKGLIGALMLDQMLNNYLSPSVLDEADNRELNDAGTPAEGKTYTTMEHKWDEAYGYLFGTVADSADPLASLGGDSFLNKYLSRVEGDDDFAGIADEVYQALKLGRAAIVVGDYETRDEQADIIKEAMSTVIGVRAVYYLQQAKNTLNTDKGAAFHDLSEGFGFVYSLRFCRKAGETESMFSRSEVGEFIDQLTAGNGFWDITAETLDAMSEEIADKFDFTVEQAGS